MQREMSRVIKSRMNLTPLVVLLLVQACSPTIAVKSDEPITINLNVKIDHEIVLRVDEELEGIKNGNVTKNVRGKKFVYIQQFKKLCLFRNSARSTT